MKDSLFSEQTLQKIQKTRKIFLKVAVWVLIIELIFSAILILSGNIWGDAFVRIQGTFLILALVLFISVNNFIRIEKGDKVMQVLASVGFVCNLIWAIFAFLLIWEVVPFLWWEETTQSAFGVSYIGRRSHLTIFAMIMLITSYAAAGGFWISNTMSIEETEKPVKPLKITAIICIVYLWIFGTIMTIIQPKYDDFSDRLYKLAGLTALAFVITACAALIISKTSEKKKAKLADKNEKQAQFTPKTDAELRAEIEEKVRREMIEKEVRARMEAEQASASGANLSDAEQASASSTNLNDAEQTSVSATDSNITEQNIDEETNTSDSTI